MVKRFPGWNEVAIANLHSLFLLFDNQSNGMLGFDDLLVSSKSNTLIFVLRTICSMYLCSSIPYKTLFSISKKKKHLES